MGTWHVPHCAVPMFCEPMTPMLPHVRAPCTSLVTAVGCVPPPRWLQICDIKAIAEMAHAAGALCCVDNSIMATMFQRPLDLGAGES
jgi:hypothetical protein